MYDMICMRSGIGQAVRVVNRFMSNLRKEHWRAVKWILRYLKGSLDMVLCYDGTNIRLRRHVDSDFAGDVDSRKSTIGYIFTLKSGTVSWVSRLQRLVALFTKKAEYVAATEACKKLI